MGRKRKLQVADAEKENEALSQSSIRQGPMYTILSSAQLNETLHKRYIKELTQLYSKMDHDAFVFTFIKMLKTVLEAEETNEYGNTALLFCAKFVTSLESEEGSHPVLADLFKWLLSTVSNNPHIRYRLCYFVNLILKEFGLQAALDDNQCDNILEYMLERLRDVSASVRKQAVLAMQRLQVPDNPDDLVLRAYQFHLSSDPSSTVRQCIITCMGRNYHTIPHILDRLWDIEETVRRHTYMNMCTYPVRSYKVSQRLTLLEQGLNDSSENVRKTVAKYMLKQWLESYNKNPIELTAALKLDSTDEEMDRFRKVAKQMLEVIFQQNDNIELLDHLPLAEEGDHHRCVPQDKVNVEVVLYWQCLTEYLQKTEADECDQVVPELSTFCSYVEKFSQLQTPDMDKFVQIEFQSMMLSLIEILWTYDLGDEIGRGNLKLLITQLLKNCLLDHKIIELLVRCTESLMTDLNERFQFLLEIIYCICELNSKQHDLVHDRNLLSKLLDNLDADLKTKISSLKVKILDLEEQEEMYVRQKEYIRAQAVNDEKNITTEEYMELLKPLMAKELIADLPDNPKLTKQQSILKGLYITYYMVVSPNVQSLNPSSCKLFNDFICRHMASNENDIREWAIKCGTAYSMLYDSFAKEVFDILFIQLYKTTNHRVWETAVNCVFELLDRYGVDNFSEQPSKRRRQGRQLFNSLDVLDVPDDVNSSNSGDAGVGVIYMMSHLLEKCEELCIVKAIVKGFCRLILHGHILDRTDILEKLMKIYFNPHTDTSINQILGVFLEHLVEMKLQSHLQPCLIPMLSNVMNANFDSGLMEVSPETITRFFINVTQQEVSTPRDNIHNKIGLSFLQEMYNNLKERKDLCKVLAKEIITLKLNIGNDLELKEKMKSLADKLIKAELDPKSIKNIINFKAMVDGVFTPPQKRLEGNESDEDCDSETVTTVSECANTVTTESEGTIVENNFELDQAETYQEQESNGSNEVAETIVSNKVPANSTTPTTEETPTVESDVATTFGHDNHVGILSLRRSLHKSISQSDNESLCESEGKRGQRITKKSDEQKKEVERTQAITRRNLRRYPAKSSTLQKTPEKKSNIQKPTDSMSIVEEKNSETNHSDDEDTSSDVITASPTISSPPEENARGLRLRSLRNRSAITTDKVSTKQPATKKNITHDEPNTPVRNGRKRVLRKSPKSKQTDRSTSASHSQSPPTISPLRKQQRTDGIEDADTPSTLVTTAATAPSTATVTASPTGSTTSSKENEAPAHANNDTSSSEKISSSQPSNTESNARDQRERTITRNTTANLTVTTSTPNNRSKTAVTTRNSARKERMNSMRVTRKRMSMELNTSGGQAMLPTPKRSQREQSTKTTNKKSTQKTSETKSTSSSVSTSSGSSSTSSSGSISDCSSTLNGNKKKGNLLKVKVPIISERKLASIVSAKITNNVSASPPVRMSTRNRHKR